jgi:hypothetical protein
MAVRYREETAAVWVQLTKVPHFTILRSPAALTAAFAGAIGRASAAATATAQATQAIEASHDILGCDPVSFDAAVAFGHHIGRADAGRAAAIELRRLATHHLLDTT